MTQTILIMDAKLIFSQVFPLITSVARNHHLQDIEHFYDWSVTEAFQSVVNYKVQGHVSLVNHNFNDLYRAIYEEVKYPTFSIVKNVVDESGLVFTTRRPLKLLVTYSELIIVRSN